MEDNLMEKTIASKKIYDGHILHIELLTNELPDGNTAPREVIRHIGAAAVVPVDAEGNVYFVRQYRAPIDRILMEIPAGKLDAKSEDHLLAAKRELEEETGLIADRWDFLCDFLPTVGYSDEVISLYLARELSAGQAHPDDDEFLNVVRIPMAEALDMAMRGEIGDGKSLAALLMAARKMESEQ